MSRATTWTAEELTEAREMRSRGISYRTIDTVFDKARGSAQGMLKRHFPDHVWIDPYSRSEKHKSPAGASHSHHVIMSHRPSDQALAERDRAYSAPQSLAQIFLGDPPQGRSALDKMETRA
jgi:hypothetical protein